MRRCVFLVSVALLACAVLGCSAKRQISHAAQVCENSARSTLETVRGLHAAAAPVDDAALESIERDQAAILAAAAGIQDLATAVDDHEGIWSKLAYWLIVFGCIGGAAVLAVVAIFVAERLGLMGAIGAVVKGTTAALQGAAAKAREFAARMIPKAAPPRDALYMSPDLYKQLHRAATGEPETATPERGLEPLEKAVPERETPPEGAPNVPSIGR